MLLPEHKQTMAPCLLILVEPILLAGIIKLKASKQALHACLHSRTEWLAMCTHIVSVRGSIYKINHYFHF